MDAYSIKHYQEYEEQRAALLAQLSPYYYGHKAPSRRYRKLAPNRLIGASMEHWRQLAAMREDLAFCKNPATYTGRLID